MPKSIISFEKKGYCGYEYSSKECCLGRSNYGNSEGNILSVMCRWVT
jgi:hypothetical protein